MLSIVVSFTAFWWMDRSDADFTQYMTSKECYVHFEFFMNYCIVVLYCMVLYNLQCLPGRVLCPLLLVSCCAESVLLGWTCL